jgi:hypothetical protein
MLFWILFGLPVGLWALGGFKMNEVFMEARKTDS